MIVRDVICTPFQINEVLRCTPMRMVGKDASLGECIKLLKRRIAARVSLPTSWNAISQTVWCPVSPHARACGVVRRRSGNAIANAVAFMSSSRNGKNRNFCETVTRKRFGCLAVCHDVCATLIAAVHFGLMPHAGTIALMMLAKMRANGVRSLILAASVLAGAVFAPSEATRAQSTAERQAACELSQSAILDLPLRFS